MSFTTIKFLFFLPIVFFLFWKVFSATKRKQNLFLLLASYVFYGAWDYRFLFLLMFSTLLDYYSGLKIASTSHRQKKLWLVLSISANLIFLCIFKYFNFFTQSFAELFNISKNSLPVLNIILPVGISFYTFHGISYVIDVYNGKIKKEKNIIDYALFVSYFPLLVAGPIERATHLLPQLKIKRQFNYSYAVNGLRQMLWGFFKKIVIADAAGNIVNTFYLQGSQATGMDYVFATFLFAIQIYGDFSGYSDIALGTSRLFGIELLRNFSYPYFSRDIAEFWRRWHISLSSWFRDYVYIPLGGSRTSVGKKIRNTFIIFTLSGLWHGASWNFVFWGFLNAIFFLPLLLFSKNRNNLDVVAQNATLPTVTELFKMIVTFSMICFTWIFFRADNISHAFEIIGTIFSPSILNVPSQRPYFLTLAIMFMFIMEWLARHKPFALHNFGENSTVWKRRIFYCTLVIIILLSYKDDVPFIYFQF